MMKQIYRLKNADECYNAATGEAVPYLTYYEPMGDDELIGTGATDATLEELVGLCDQDAESVNAHDFCGAHRVLGGLLYRETGREAATKLMREIALRGGLHGMNGACTDDDAYDEFGVGDNGRDWNGTYGE
jgi:hypothetical protein